MSDLVFYVNGKKIIKYNPSPRTVLAEFLRRELKLTGTKISCGEGACGACTVLVSKFDHSTSKILHYSVNSCLTPICSLHGLAVTTVEAVGSMRTRLHPIQERLTAAHGVQCGFCSPGMVMSMFALLRNNPQPSELEIEHAIKGNLCRCTGYRPILDAFRSFAKGSDSCPMGALCCQNNVSQTQDVDVVSDCTSSDKQWDGTQELIFPSELQLSDQFAQTSLTFGSETDVLWRRPVSLIELLTLRQQHPEAVLSAGNSSVAFFLKRQQLEEKSSVIISTTGVRELSEYRHSDEELFIGSQISMSQLENILSDLNTKLPDCKTRLVGALLNMLKVFGSKQIRNIATVGGSLALASSWSDINAVLLVGLCTVELASIDSRRQVAITEFFTGAAQTCVRQDEVILGINIPFSVENEHFASFKQSVRRDMCLSDVTAAIGMRLSAESDTIERICLSVGGLTLPSLKYFNGVEGNGLSKLIGQKWDRQAIEAILPEIIQEVQCHSANDETKRYQLLSLQGFLLRFHMEVCEKLVRKQELTESEELYLSLTSEADSSIHSGVQVYHLEQPVSDTDSVGQPLVHRWAKQCTTGEAVFTDDILPSDGELYVVLVASERASARIMNVDPSSALAIPGVVGYIDHKSVPGFNETGAILPSPVFAVEQVHHIGQTIGAIVATSQRLAQLGASQVKVDYEDLPAIITIEDAIAHNSFHPYHHGSGQIKRGDTTAGFQSANHVIEGQFRIGGQEHFYLENNGARAVPKGEDGEMEVHLGCQTLTTVQEAVARVLNVTANKITVHMKRMGGAFGGKEFRTTLAAMPSAIAAQKYGRPARCVFDRHEDMQKTGHRRPYLFKYKIGFMDSGKIMAIDADVYANDGYYPEIAFLLMNQTMMFTDNCYAIPNVNIRGHLCKTNLQSRCAMRGAGIPQGILFCENLVREVANYLNMSALQIQLLNMLHAGELALGNVPVEATLGRCLDDVLKQSDYVAECQRIEDFNKKSKHIKRGIAVVPVRFPPCLPAPFNQGGALVHIYLDGSVLLTHGGAECGQGLNTKMMQIASRALGAPIEVIHHSVTSTNTVPNTSVTGGSSGSDINGAAVLNACTTLAERLKPFRLANPTGTWKDWVNAAYGAGVSLSCAGYWCSPFGGRYDWQTHEGQAHAYLTYGAGVTQVQLDCLTGHFTIPKVDIVMDIGKSLNPALDVGQIEGAFIMGLGFFTVEDHRYNAEGRLETVGASKYKIPSVSSIPLQMNVTLLKESANQHAVYSSKGIGEPPLLTSCSVFLALKEAIKAARADASLPSSFRLDSPATVSRILLATHTAEVPRRL